MKCTNCGAEILLGQICCDSRNTVFIGKKLVKDEIRVPDYWDRLSELKRTGKFNSKTAFYSSH